MRGSNGSSRPGPNSCVREPRGPRLAFRFCAKKRVTPHPIRERMSILRGRGEPRCRSARAGRSRTVVLWAGTLAAIAVLITPISASAYGTSVSWTNGTVLCQFAPDSPSVGVSALNQIGNGLVLSLANVTEVGPAESVAAVADLTGVTWAVTNRSSGDAYDLAYSGRASLVDPSGSTSLGSAELSVDFVLPAYDGSPNGTVDAVEVVLVVANWTWQAPGDYLTLAFAATPSFPAAEHLSATSDPGWLLADSDNASGSENARVGADSPAYASSGTGAVTPVNANFSVTILSAEHAIVRVALAASAGAFSSLSFTARVGVVLPTQVAGVPLAGLAAAGGGALLAVFLAAAVTYRVRRRPSELIYMTEEEQP